MTESLGDSPLAEFPYLNSLLFNDTNNASLSPEYVLDSNSTEAGNDSYSKSIVVSIIESLLLAMIILLTVIGNVLVIAAILRERNLRGVGNCLVLSLAVADLMVACLVMPLGAVYAVTQKWTMGPVLCDVWTCCDVLCCTASILHLLAIAVDRYWSVTNIDYVRKRSIRRTGYMIMVAWGIACAVSLPPIFGWKFAFFFTFLEDPNFKKRVETDKKCTVSQDLYYQVFATGVAFYIPLVIILAIYWKMFQVVRRRIWRKPGRPTSVRQSNICNQTLSMDEVPSTLNSFHSPDSGNTQSISVAKRNNSSAINTKILELKREGKAANVLTMVTGVFIICWLPFFIMALIETLRPSLKPSETVFFVVLWLGYANSMMNPIICTMFSPNYKHAFKKMFCRNECFSQSQSISRSEKSNPGTGFQRRVKENETCVLNLDVTYRVFVTCTAFLFPLCTILYLYWKICQVARNGLRNKPGCQMSPADEKSTGQTLSPPTPELSTQSGSSALYISDYSLYNTTTGQILNIAESSAALPQTKQKRKRRKKKSIRSEREKKLSKILALVTGAFILCWFPAFFTMSLRALCFSCGSIEQSVWDFVFWLGYINSMLNPIIYTIFIQDFRIAFKKLLCKIFPRDWIR